MEGPPRGRASLPPASRGTPGLNEATSPLSSLPPKLTYYCAQGAQMKIGFSADSAARDVIFHIFFCTNYLIAEQKDVVSTSLSNISNSS
jgi:hypothetical protein